MSEPQMQSPELDLPVASLLALRRALEAELGADTAARALQQAGHAAGDALFAAFAGSVRDGDVADLDEAEFWRRLRDLFADRGWGTLHFEDIHPGVGALESSDWAEADPAEGALRPSCYFTAGLLANLLGRTANEDVGILEVECRSRGDLRCRFLFGGHAALEWIHGELSAGRDVESTLADLG
jgi:predicted hydrocarbon binding protein